MDVPVYLRIEMHLILLSHFINKETETLRSYVSTVTVPTGDRAWIHFLIQVLCHACKYQNILFIRPTVIPMIVF